MELTGKIIEVQDPITGTSSKGDWIKQTYVLETDGQYPKTIAFSVWKDNVSNFAIKMGETVTVSIDIESREFNGKWYTDVKAWQCRKESAMPKIESKPAQAEESEDDDSGLPF